MSITVFQATGAAVVLRFVVLQFEEALPECLTNHVWKICLLAGFFAYILDRAVFYPQFRNPLRRFPIVGATNVIAERPRGKTPLSWFRKHPDADAVVMHSPLGRCVIFPASPDALRDIISTNSYDWEKPWGIRAFLGRVIGFGLIMSEGDAHRKQRKSLTPAFNIRNIRALYPLMWHKTQTLLHQLEKENESQGCSEISHWASRLTLDIIGPAALSREFSTLTTEDDPVAEAFGELLDPSPELVTFMISNMVLPQWLATRLPVRANRLIKDHCTKLRHLCRTILDEKHDAMKQAEEGQEDDILKYIIASGEFTDDEVIDQMLTFLAAGHETTASALTWSTYLLAGHPETQARLRTEVRECVTSPVTPSMLESMPLLNGVCEEVFRLFPTVPLTIREAQRDTVVAGVGVPKGTVALLVPYAINRHPLNWGADAEDFSPERWIDKTVNGQRPNKHGGACSNFCETTFLHGPRSCIGRDFAKAELRCAVAGLVGRFEFEMVEPGEEVVVGGTVTTKPVNGLKLRMRRV